MRFPSSLAFTAMSAALLLAGCSQSDPGPFDNRSQDESAAPDIAPSAAPDVALRYAYRFALAPDSIAAVQEKHAATCEALGLARCRIAGVRYVRYSEDTVSADLELMLAPDIARSFGKDATNAVIAAKGNLRSLVFEGEDQSGALRAGEDAIAAAGAERERLEKLLADPHAPREAKAGISRDIGEQNSRALAAAQSQREARARIAATPVRFDYSTEGFISGIRLDRTATSALGVAASLLNGLLGIIVVLAALTIPAGLILLAIAHGKVFVTWLWRRLAPAQALSAD